MGDIQKLRSMQQLYAEYSEWGELFSGGRVVEHVLLEVELIKQSN